MHAQDSPRNVPRIVIIGGGAGGLVLATLLGRKLGKRKQAHIILVDAQLTHIWKPLLHEVAAGSLNPYEDELNYFAQAHRNHFEFQPGTLTGLDRQRKVILLDDMQHESGQSSLLPPRELAYDFLVLAIGSISNDFGTPGAKEFTTHLDTRHQAEHLHRTLLSHYYRAQASGNSENLGVAIVGAGATGVELSAEVHHAATILTRYGLDQIQPANVSITLIEAAPRILPALDEKIATNAMQELQRIGVQVMVNERVSQITEEGIHTASGKFISAQIRVWAAGVKAQDFMQGLGGLANNKGNTLTVDAWLRTEDPAVFAMGDCAYCVCRHAGSNEERATPPRAQTAFLQAKWLAKHLPDLIQRRQVPSFVYRDYGSLISLSEARAVGSLMGNLTGTVNVQGRLARLMYISLYRRHQAVLYGWTRMMVFMLKDLLIRNSGPRLKMH